MNDDRVRDIIRSALARLAEDLGECLQTTHPRAGPATLTMLLSELEAAYRMPTPLNVSELSQCLRAFLEAELPPVVTVWEGAEWMPAQPGARDALTARAYDRRKYEMAKRRRRLCLETVFNDVTTPEGSGLECRSRLFDDGPLPPTEVPAGGYIDAAGKFVTYVEVYNNPDAY
jgi:hypothetical protein